jgi:hypothetical protein
MERRASHLIRDALLVGCAYVLLIAVGWIAIGFGGAVIVAIGAGALIALALPLTVIYEEEEELLHPHGRGGR